RKLTEYEIDRLLEFRRQPKHDLDIVDDATYEDLDHELVQGFIARQRQLSPRGFQKFSDEEILHKTGVLRRTQDGQIKVTLGGLLALGKFPQEFFPRLCVTWTLYPGTEKVDKASEENGKAITRYLDTHRLIGPIPAMIADTIELVTKNMHTGALIDARGRRDLPDYPAIAVREAIANALQHRDYSPLGRTSQVQVNMFQDRLEIINPGGLMGAANEISIMESGISATRNSFLSEILATTPMSDGTFVVENRGTGLRTIRQALLEAKKNPPKLHNTLATFTLTFERTSHAARRGKANTATIGEAIMRVLEAEGEQSITSLCERLCCSRSTVQKNINLLLENGRVRALGDKNSPKRRYRAA
ncbi:MAG: hypothetical protein HUK26_04865, partial [Duodenibacillus sp.]|nr:hypothetical protein [Duodenibacillus sp.]